MNPVKHGVVPLALIVLVFAVAFVGCSKDGIDVTAKVLSVDGTAEIKNASAQSFVSAKVNDTLDMGGVFKTGEASLASLEIINRGIVEIKPDSIFELEAGKDSIFQKAGVAIYKIDKNKEGFKVKAPHAVTCVLGTRFVVRILDGMTVVGVEEGRVSVTANNGEIREIAAGKKITIENSGFRGAEEEFDVNTDSFNYLQIDGKWVPKE
ncbi:MAG: hypothetical protein CVV42_07600 [Candidatus Riflebacteria bacterium HGW-Riflebacteria-2]|jgi:hypothetical protein|nr:MAG: hypothetical protein CVV42_07600 [Candidatus Riflebacteria bacterium HGW-Riflebacteria-2]